MFKARKALIHHLSLPSYQSLDRCVAVFFSLSIAVSLTACSAKFNRGGSSSAVTSDEISNSILPSFVLGKASFEDNENMEKGLSTPAGIFTDGTRLVITDSGNHRVLIYNSIPVGKYPRPDVVVGQPGLNAAGGNWGGLAYRNIGGVSAKSLNNPRSAYIDGNRLYVADLGNHRVLIWNSIPKTDFTPADIVLGQSDFTSNLANRGKSSLTGDQLSSPSSIVSVGNKLIISDTGNHRVLVWNNKDLISNGSVADVVIGQSLFSTKTANSPSRSAATLHTPRGLATDGSRLLIADTGNSRVLVYNSVPVVSGGSANVILGQSAVNGGSAGLTQSTLSSPNDVQVAGGRVFVADTNNRRIMIWNSIPTSHGTQANLVLGQSTFSANATACTSATNASQFCSLTSAASDGTRIFATDTGNHRSLVWNIFPGSSGQAADGVIGQPDLVGYYLQNANSTSGSSFNKGRYVMKTGSTFFWAGEWENRILIWDSIPTQTGVSARVAIGQPDLNSFIGNNDTGGVSARTINSPRGFWTDGTRFAIADTGNNRVLIWNKIPAQTFTPADIVLGQPNFTSNTANTGLAAPTAQTLSTPVNIVLSDDGKLVVSDYSNHRVLVWNTFPTSNFAPADVVIGQPDMFTKTANTNGISARTFSNPNQIGIDSGKLIVQEEGNSRVLIFNSIPVTNSAPADVVLLQPDFTSTKSYSGTGAAMNNGRPRGMIIQDHRLILSTDVGKLLIWNSIPTQSFAPADYLYGLIDHQLGSNKYSYTFSAMLFSTPEYLYLPDSGFNRVAVYPFHPIGFHSMNITNSSRGQLTALDCNGISHILVNETSRPSSSDASWQKCSTTPGSMSFELQSPSEGIHELKVWMKNEAGLVKSEPIVLPYLVDLTPPAAPWLQLASANPTSSSALTLTSAECSDTPHLLISETSAAPSAESDKWFSCETTAGAMSYTLSNTTPGSHVIYVWGKDKAGNVSKSATTLSVTLNP